MTMNPALDLQVAIYDALVAATSLSAELGGPHIFDDVPQKTQMPYITFADIETRNWDTQTSVGHEHIVTLHVWSDQRGRKQIQEIIAQIDEILDNQGLILQQHYLINLHVIFWSALRVLEGKGYQGIVRLRAVTEKI